METLKNLFHQEEVKMIADAKAEIAIEKIEWAAKTQEQRDEISSARDRKLAAISDAADACDDDEEEDDE